MHLLEAIPTLLAAAPVDVRERIEATRPEPDLKRWDETWTGPWYRQPMVVVRRDWHWKPQPDAWSVYRGMRCFRAAAVKDGFVLIEHGSGTNEHVIVRMAADGTILHASNEAPDVLVYMSIG